MTPPLVSAYVGVAGRYDILLDLGPRATPYLSGFVAEYEVEATSRVHWSTREASIQLPVAVRGGPLRVSYRFARPLSEPATIDVELAGQQIDRFAFPGGRFRVRESWIPVREESPLTLSFFVDSTDSAGLGLRLDWVRFELGPSTRTWLTGPARWTPAVLALVSWVFLVATGWSSHLATALVAPLSTALTAGLLWDPWLTHRIIRDLPLPLLLYGALLVLSVCALRRWGILSARDGRVLAALMMSAFIVRASAVEHPGFYHPDLRTHARFVQIIREGGGDFFRAPSDYILRHGVWKREAYGREYAFPYSPAFHLPFVPLPLDYDGLVTFMPIAAAAWSTIPIASIWILARRLGLSTMGALLMLLVPTYVSRLSYAFLPSLFGHGVDVAFVCWVATRLDRLSERSVMLVGALLLSACQLAYVSGGLNVGAFVVTLALILVPRDGGARRSLALATMLALGTIFSVTLYYRDFVGMVLDLLPRVLGAADGAETVYPTRSFFAVSYERIHGFFDGIYPLLTAAGLWLIARKRAPGGPALGAWTAAYFVLLLARAKMPDIFLRGHESLFVTPLVCLASGEALAGLLAEGGVKRILGQLLLAALAAQGLYFQWRAIAAQVLASV